MILLWISVGTNYDLLQENQGKPHHIKQHQVQTRSLFMSFSVKCRAAEDTKLDARDRWLVFPEKLLLNLNERMAWQEDDWKSHGKFRNQAERWVWPDDISDGWGFMRYFRQSGAPRKAKLVWKKETTTEWNRARTITDQTTTMMRKWRGPGR